MTPTEIIDVLEAQFGEKIREKKLEALDPHVVVDAADLVEVSRYLKSDPRLKFETLQDITGVDYLEPDPKKAPKSGFEPHLEVVYHFQSFTHRHRFTLKLVLPRLQEGRLPEVPTLTGLWRSADWHEREVYDLVGIDFVGHPDLRRILLSEDWVGHPLRKDYEFPLEYHGIRGR